jgi:hypothetical protein
MKIYTNIDVFFNNYEFSAKKIKKSPLETATFLITSKPI